MAISTATVQRCKLAFIREQTCDPELTFFGQTWEWIKGNGSSVGVNCLDQQDKYYACVAAGIPAPPAPAPPPIPTTPAGWYDPTLPQQADDATRARQAGYADTIRHYLDVVTGSDDDDAGGNPLGIKTEYLLYGALAVAGVLLVRGRR